MKPSALAEHFFRHEYSRLVANLSRQVGIQHIELIEDCVQSALLTGLESWTYKSLPENPAAWLYRVSSNNIISHLRQSANRERILLQWGNEFDGDIEISQEYISSRGFDDDLLQMLFVCCNDSIPKDSQLILALKVLCGFGIKEISHRLFCSEASVYKRYSRAKNNLQENSTKLFDLDNKIINSRLERVHRVLYSIFAEGYLSVNNEYNIRLELCNEAIRLMSILVEHSTGQTPETYALLALMYFQTARIAGRQDGAGGLLLLEEQDRSTWDQQKIYIGLKWLEKSATGENFSQYHAEAGVAAEHCLAPSFEDTQWDKITQCYLLLEQKAPSAIHKLNRAVAVAEWQGPQAGLNILENFNPPAWLTGSYLWCAVLADLNLRCGKLDKAKRYRETALILAPTHAVKDLLERRLNFALFN